MLEVKQKVANDIFQVYDPHVIKSAEANVAGRPPCYFCFLTNKKKVAFILSSILPLDYVYTD